MREMGVVRGLMRAVAQRWPGGARLMGVEEGTRAGSGAGTGTEAETSGRNPEEMEKRCQTNEGKKKTLFPLLILYIFYWKDILEINPISH